MCARCAACAQGRAAPHQAPLPPTPGLPPWHRPTHTPHARGAPPAWWRRFSVTLAALWGRCKAPAGHAALHHRTADRARVPHELPTSNPSHPAQRRAAGLKKTLNRLSLFSSEVERLLRKQQVGGSIPPRGKLCDFFLDRSWGGARKGRKRRGRARQASEGGWGRVWGVGRGAGGPRVTSVLRATEATLAAGRGEGRSTYRHLPWQPSVGRPSRLAGRRRMTRSTPGRWRRARKTCPRGR
jgi:hypothetical protein